MQKTLRLSTQTQTFQRWSIASTLLAIAMATGACAQGAGTELRNIDESQESQVTACGGTELASMTSYSFAGELSQDSLYETSCRAGEGNDSVMHWHVPVTGVYEVSIMSATFVPVLALFAGECTDSEFRCDRGSETKSGRPSARIELFAGSDVTLVVQPEDATQGGTFVLDVEYLGPAWE